MKFLKRHVLFTPENPLIKPKGVYTPTVPEVLEFLKNNGEKAEAVKGKYGSEENSIMVHNPQNPEGLLNIARDLGQESAIISNDGKHEMHFLNGPYKGKIVKGLGTNIFNKEPEDLYTTVHTLDGPQHFQHNFDFSTLFDDMKKSEQESNWVMPNEETARQEYEWEYKDKGWYSKFNKFHTPEEFHDALKNSQVIAVTPAIDKHIRNRSHCKSVEDLKELVSSYKYPRDVDRIVKGIKDGDKMPYPIVVKHQGEMSVIGGNTRMDVAKIHGVNPQALLLDMDKEFVVKGEFKERAIDELEKGSLQSRHPFKPSQVPEDEREAVEDWTGMEKPEARELIPEMKGNARFRALHKLHGKTQVRVNPQTKEREFLLHRGMSGDEFVKNVKNGKVNHTKMSSWTPIKAAADGHVNGNEFVDGHSGGTVLSAWIPESKIHYAVPQIGQQKFDIEGWKQKESFNPNQKQAPMQKLNEFGKPAFEWEQEIIVKPNHNSEIDIPPEEALAASESREINNLEKSSKSDRLEKLRNILEKEDEGDILDIPESEILKWSAKWK